MIYLLSLTTTSLALRGVGSIDFELSGVTSSNSPQSSSKTVLSSFSSLTQNHLKLSLDQPAEIPKARKIERWALVRADTTGP
jgi:hypothetical protein